MSQRNLWLCGAVCFFLCAWLLMSAASLVASCPDRRAHLTLCPEPPTNVLCEDLGSVVCDGSWGQYREKNYWTDVYESGRYAYPTLEEDLCYTEKPCTWDPNLGSNGECTVLEDPENPSIPHNKPLWADSSCLTM